jgi:hypothetical protein
VWSWEGGVCKIKKEGGNTTLKGAPLALEVTLQSVGLTVLHKLVEANTAVEHAFLFKYFYRGVYHWRRPT